MLCEESYRRWAAAAEAAAAPAAPPRELVCAISQQLMRFPVRTAAGDVHEVTAIARWLRHNDTNPCTNEILAHKVLVPDAGALAAVRAWVGK
jgi:hypothetical protein